MANKEFVLLVLLGLVTRGLTLSCFGCPLDCGVPPFDCTYGVVRDVCGCCDECGRGPFEECGEYFGVTVGQCGDGLVCGLPPPGYPNPNAPGVCEYSRRSYGEECGFSVQCEEGLECVPPPPGYPNLNAQGICEYSSHTAGWTHATNACITGNNDRVLRNVNSLDDCRSRCQAPGVGFYCRSVEYNSVARRCVLSKADSSSFRFRNQCHKRKWVFSEIIDAPPFAPGGGAPPLAAAAPPAAAAAASTLLPAEVTGGDELAP